MAGDFGIGDPRTVYKRKFRWLFKIKDVIADGMLSLPPVKAARPKLSFKEIEVQHLHEVAFFPGKPDWGSFTVQCLESRCKTDSLTEPVETINFQTGATENTPATFSPTSCPDDHPLVKWYNKLYRPELDGPEGYKFFVNESSPDDNFSKEARLQLYDGCGRCIEQWVFDNCWPQAIDFEDLDMGSNDVVCCTITFRYARAYLEVGCFETADGGGA